MKQSLKYNNNDSISLDHEYIYIGVDVGGTKTDTVLMNGKKIIATFKTNTTQNVTYGIKTAINNLLHKSKYPPSKINAVMVGTTHFINAVLQGETLNKVMAIRIGRPATTIVEPFFDWPENLCNAVNVHREIIYGGHEYNGNEITKLDIKKLEELAYLTKTNHIKAVAISGVFSAVNPAHEIEAFKILKKINPDLSITLSHELGGLNLLIRENAAILNASLRDQFKHFSSSIKNAIKQLNLKNATIFFSSNDGTLEDIQSIFPIKTYCSGQTNSIRGASILTNILNALVVDIGGTSCDIGILKNGFPLESGFETKIGNEQNGISCSFPAPLIRSYGLGGGSIIKASSSDDIRVGPASVGFELHKKAIIFGGKILTVTDIAVAKGRLTLGEPALLNSIDKTIINKADDIMHNYLADIINKMLPFIKDDGAISLVLVGGGAYLFDKEKLLDLLDNQFENILIPKFAECANAIGAASAKISGSFTGLFHYSEITGTIPATPRSKAIEIATQKAAAEAIAKGANAATLKLHELEETSIAYLPGNQTKIRLKIIGDLNTSQNSKLENKPDKNKSLYDLSRDEHPIINITEQDEKSDAAHKQHQYITAHESNKEIIDPAIKKIDTSSDYTNILSEKDVCDISFGAGFLGSGGGGNTKMCEVILKSLIHTKNKIEMIPYEQLPDNSLIVATGLMGAPTVLAEKIPSKEEGIKVIQVMQDILQEQIDYLIPLEIGGMNGLYAMYISSQANKIIVDGDYMGRALPEIQMVTPNIYRQIDQCIAVLANAQEHCILEAKNLKELELQARLKTTEMGGVVTIAYLPMRGKYVRKYCVPSSISVSQKIGNILCNFKGINFVKKFNETLTNTLYGPAELILFGKIVDLQRKFDQGFNKGHAIIQDYASQQLLRIDFQNENLRIINLSTKKVISAVPTIITLLDNEYKPLSCECLRMGIEVTVITLEVPEILCSQDALSIIGPQAFNLDEYSCIN